MSKVIFLHIIKCAGTSLRTALAQQFAWDKIAPVPVGSSGKWDYPTIAAHSLHHQATITPESVKHYDLVMSHYDWRIAEQLPQWNVITMFRHPVAQLHSQFRFMQSSPGLKTIHANMQHMDFYEWMQSDLSALALNVQTRYLSAHGEEDIDKALLHLHDKRLTFGLVERFEDSIALFNQRFGWSLNVLHENRTPLQNKLSHKEIELATSLQFHDMRLYKEVCELFEEQTNGY